MARYDTDGSNALSPNDPYNEMDRPNFNVINGGKSNNKSSKSAASKNQQKNSDSQNLLRNSENSSLSNRNQVFGKNNDPDENGSPWSNSVRGKAKLPTKRGIKLTGKRKGLVATFIILGLLLGGGIFLGGTNSLLAPAFESLVTEATDTQYASDTYTSVRLSAYLLKHLDNPSAPYLKRYSYASENFKKRLTKNNLELAKQADGTGILIWSKPQTDGSIITEYINGDSFKSFYNKNPEFRNDYTKAKRGRVVGFFDNIANRIYTNLLKLSRDIFSDAKNNGDETADEQDLDRRMKNQNSNEDPSNTIGYETSKEIDKTDDQGNIIRDQNGNPIKETVVDQEAVTIKRTESAKKYITDIADTVAKVTEIGQIGCGVWKVANMIYMVASATELYQSINLAMPFGESISKTMAGKGNEADINTVLNTLATPETSTIENYDPSKGEIGETIVNPTKAPIENSTLRAILSSSKVDPNDGINYSLERIGNTATSKIFEKFAASNEITEACISIKAGSAIMTIVTDVLSLGTATIGRFVLKTLFSITIGVVSSIAIAEFLSFLIPTVARILFTNPWESSTGIVLGAVIARGFSAANTRIGRNGSGQSLSSADAAIAYNQLNQQVIAMDAEVDRLNRSPFDVTSKNTFLGSIAYNLLPLNISGGSGTLSSVLRTTSKSISSIMGSVSAAGEGSSYMTTFGNCSHLEAIGAKGDIYCNPITTTDPSSLDMTPETYMDYLIKNGLITTDANGVITITDGDKDTCLPDANGNSVCDLARYINYCSERDSPFGIHDAGILEQLEIDGGIILNSAPIIGGIFDLANAVLDQLNLDWSSGQKCTNNPDTNPQWAERFTYIQRFIQDQRILDNIGADNLPNPVTAYIEKHEAENPVDNTYEGYLARISGLTKKDVETVLALIDYYNFLEDYDPSSRIAMEGDASDIETSSEVIAAFSHSRLDFTQNIPIDDESEKVILANQYIIYADVRNRSYAA